MTRLAILFLLAARVAHADGEPAGPIAPPDDPAKPTNVPAAPDPSPAEKPAADKPSEPPPQKVTVVLANGLLQRQGISPELTITGGVKLWSSDSAASRWWMARVRAGAIIYFEPKFLTIGVAGQFSALGSRSLGVEVQAMDLWSGIWVQGGVFPLDTTHGVSLEAAIGYGLFGLEFQRRVSGARGGEQSLCLFLNIPIGLLRVVVKDPEGVIHPPPRPPTAASLDH